VLRKTPAAAAGQKEVPPKSSPAPAAEKAIKKSQTKKEQKE